MGNQRRLEPAWRTGSKTMHSPIRRPSQQEEKPRTFSAGTVLREPFAARWGLIRKSPSESSMSIQTPAEYHAQAERARELATWMRDPHLAETLRRVAADFEIMAEQAADIAEQVADMARQGER